MALQKEFAPRAEKLEDDSYRKVIELKKASDISISAEISRCASRPLLLPSSRMLTNRCGENKEENVRRWRSRRVAMAGIMEV